MFGKNEIVGKKFFADKEELLVVSKFMTMQGEGPYNGHPAFFVRLAKCNLNCSFCDAYFDDGDYYKVSDLIKEIKSDIQDYYAGNPELNSDGRYLNIGLVVTGGEPTLQPKLFDLLKEADKIFSWTQIESNGIIAATNIPDTTMLVISPKCLEKNDVAVRYLAPTPYSLERADCLKFVMTYDLESLYSTIPDWAFEWRKETGKPIYVSPMNFYKKMPAKFNTEYGDTTIEGRSTVDEVISFWEDGLLDMEKNKLTHEHTANYAIRNGLIFNLQSHLYAGVA